MFRLIKVAGDSMSPALRDGDYILIKKARSLRPGFVVVADHPRLGRIVKRVMALDENGITLAGDNPSSTASVEIGPMQPEQLRGRAILAITPKGLQRL
jgi:nickel-type superoxide dismutase maturation protease